MAVYTVVLINFKVWSILLILEYANEGRRREEAGEEADLSISSFLPRLCGADTHWTYHRNPWKILPPLEGFLSLITECKLWNSADFTLSSANAVKKNFGNKSFRLDGSIRPEKLKLIVIQMSIGKVFRAANHTDLPGSMRKIIHEPESFLHNYEYWQARFCAELTQFSVELTTWPVTSSYACVLAASQKCTARSLGLGGDVMIFVSPQKEYIMFLTGDLPGVF